MTPFLKELPPMWLSAILDYLPSASRNPVPASLTVQGGSFRIFFVSSGATVSVSGLAIAGGSADKGGGILNNGTLTLSNSTLYNNRAYNSSFSGEGGGIFNAGTLTLSNS